MSPTQTPVTILTGFLGSGKTTVLQKMLAAEHYGDTAVLINEFGEVGIDQQLVAPVSPNVVLLDSGCLCCQIRGELKDSLVEILDARAQKQVPPFKRIVIETTGLAEPTPIVATIQADPLLIHQLSVAHIITVVDAVNGNEMAQSGNAVWTQQVTAANMILIAKADLAPEAAAQLETRFAAMLPGVTVLRHGLNDPLPDFNRLPAATRRQTTGYRPQNITTHGDVHSLAFSISEPVDWTAFGVWLSALLHVHGRSILRIKGILNIGEDYPVLINGVQHMIYPPQHLSEWPHEPHDSQLVIIMTGLDAGRVEASFRRHVLEI
ncbi:CobW family GTP-binding protein [Neisseria wadsworthii]|uniref:Cobalamin synthesis protein/P47K family protein n=1 Tax=Neisseria wadsworthii 9715 TaxID=1030841 RepID=G4CMP6_9NEIS|nr:GTP-binding protein [Neisseria wadsworthii]EGZ51029.1 cobalamin synthesis protein/P47K family protein [Neisseria wadsworthii 9715]QMT36370.1 GTP-binding protein [Neisseria wadsworthii]